MSQAEPATAAPVYLDGQLVPAAEARLPVNDHGVAFGLGFYETFRTSGGRPHQWPYHQRRLTQACATAGIALPPGTLALDEAKLARAIASLLAAAGWRDAVFRYTLTAGVPAESGASTAAPYVEPHELLALRALPAPAPREGVVLHVLQHPRDSGEWLPRPKSIACGNVLLGAAELRRRGAPAHDEGLFLSREGWVVETVRQNVAWIREGRIHFPDPAIGAIAGTALAWLLELGAPASACRATLDELATAEAGFVLNSVRGITPVRELRGRRGETLVTDWPSFEHPIITSLRRQWQEAIEDTGRGARPAGRAGVHA